MFSFLIGSIYPFQLRQTIFRKILCFYSFRNALIFKYSLRARAEKSKSRKILNMNFETFIRDIAKKTILKGFERFSMVFEDFQRVFTLQTMFHHLEKSEKNRALILWLKIIIFKTFIREKRKQNCLKTVFNCF